LPEVTIQKHRKFGEGYNHLLNGERQADNQEAKLDWEKKRTRVVKSTLKRYRKNDKDATERLKIIAELETIDRILNKLATESSVLSLKISKEIYSIFLERQKKSSLFREETMLIKCRQTIIVNVIEEKDLSGISKLNFFLTEEKNYDVLIALIEKLTLWQNQIEQKELLNIEWTKILNYYFMREVYELPDILTTKLHSLIAIAEIKQQEEMEKLRKIGLESSPVAQEIVEEKRRSKELQ